MFVFTPAVVTKTQQFVFHVLALIDGFVWKMFLMTHCMQLGVSVSVATRSDCVLEIFFSREGRAATCLNKGLQLKLKSYNDSKANKWLECNKGFLMTTKLRKYFFHRDFPASAYQSIIVNAERSLNSGTLCWSSRSCPGSGRCLSSKFRACSWVAHTRCLICICGDVDCRLK